MKRKELAVVYLANDGSKFITKEEALEHDRMLDARKDFINNRRSVKVKEIGKVFTQILKENNWGVYYISKPINQLNVQDGDSPLFTVNKVDEDTVRDAFLQELSRRIKQIEEREWKSTSQADSETNLNSDTG